MNKLLRFSKSIEKKQICTKISHHMSNDDSYLYLFSLTYISISLAMYKRFIKLNFLFEPEHVLVKYMSKHFNTMDAYRNSHFHRLVVPHGQHEESFSFVFKLALILEAKKWLSVSFCMHPIIVLISCLHFQSKSFYYECYMYGVSSP